MRRLAVVVVAIVACVPVRLATSAAPTSPRPAYTPPASTQSCSVIGASSPVCARTVAARR
jgi:hypothetical protein